MKFLIMDEVGVQLNHGFLKGSTHGGLDRAGKRRLPLQLGEGLLQLGKRKSFVTVTVLGLKLKKINS